MQLAHLSTRLQAAWMLALQPINAKAAKYADAPPWPTEENNNAAKKMSGISKKISEAHRQLN